MPNYWYQPCCMFLKDFLQNSRAWVVSKFALFTGVMFCHQASPAQPARQVTDTAVISSFDNFTPNPYSKPSYVIIKSTTSGKALYQANTINGQCATCYEGIVQKADSLYQKQEVADAATLYAAAFMLNNNMGKVKHRLNAACCYVQLKQYDAAFDNLHRVVFGAKFKNMQLITSNACFKPLYADSRWPVLLEGLHQNLDAVEQKIKAESLPGQ